MDCRAGSNRTGLVVAAGTTIRAISWRPFRIRDSGTPKQSTPEQGNTQQGYMARTRKARPQAKTARTSGAPKTAAGRKAARRAKSGKAPAPDPLDRFVEAAARLLALPLEPQWLPA